MSRSIGLGAVLLALLPAVARADDDKVFVGYLYGEARNINFSLYTHICHAFVTADADGSLRPGRNAPSRTLTGDAHKVGVKVLLSLGGWGWDKQFAAIVSEPDAEDRYVKAVLDMVAQFDYDGIDLDWEYPDTEAEVVGFERLTRRLRAGLTLIGNEKNRAMLLTIAASSNPGTIRWLKTDFLLETMDWINVMTYDYTGDWTDYAGHHSPLHASSKQKGTPRSSEATIAYLMNERRVPANRLALGIPLYGRGFAVSEPYASTKGAPKARMPEGNYKNVARLIEQGWVRRWDDETKNPWLISPDGKTVIGYDDAESVAIKAKWAKEKGLRGVFSWEINADRMPNGGNPLQEAARKGLFGSL